VTMQTPTLVAADFPQPGMSPWWRIALSLFLVLVVASGVVRLHFDNSTDAFFMKGDSTMQEYSEFRRMFASDEYSLITVQMPTKIDAAFVNGLVQLERRLTKLPNVRKVTSLASVRNINGRDGDLNVRGYLEGVLPADLPSRLEQARKHPYYRDLYISSDGRYMGIVVETAIRSGEIDYKLQLRKELQAAVAESYFSALKPTLVGAPVLDADVRDMVGRESGQFGAMVFVIVSIGFYFVFRSWIAVLIPLVVAFLSILVTFGAMGWLGSPITLLTPIIPSFLISVGVGSNIFLMSHYFRHRLTDKLAARRQVTLSTREMLRPCALASGTTIASLFAFSSSDIVPVSQVGVALGIGLLAALMLTFTLGTAWLYLAAPLVSPRQAERLAQRSQWLSKLDRIASRYQYPIVFTALAVTVVAAYGLTKLKIDYYYLGTFKESTSIRQQYAESDARLPRSTAIEVLVTAKAVDAMKDPELLKRLDTAQRAIETYSALPVKTYSMVDVAKEINKALNNDNPQAYRLPDSRNALAQSLLLFESSGSDEMTRLVTPDYKTARITIQLPTVPESRSRELHKYIDTQFALALNGSGAEYKLTGLVSMWMKINGYLRDTQITSVLLAFSVTLLVLLVYTRSIKIGLMLAAVNASVVLIVLGFMVLMGWSLDPYTVLIADIAIGVLDDDTVHFYTDIRDGMRQGLSFDDAVSAARASSGQAMYYLGGCLIAGFLVYLASSVASLSAFGVLVALVIATGVIWEWLVMPAYLSIFHRLGWFKV
jgi:predicted RND superfamily exporter protein